MSILITIFLNSIFDELLASISFSFYFGYFSCSFMWSIFLCLAILAASLCVCAFYILGRSVMTPSVGRVASPVVRYPCLPELGVPGMSLVWVMWALLL